MDVKTTLNELWARSTPITGDDPVAKYLHMRGLSLTPSNVRYCSDCHHNATKKAYPAMIARISNAQGAPVGLHSTYLDPDVPNKADIEGNKTITSVLDTPSGCAVRLFDPAENLFEDGFLGIATSIESAVSVSQIYGVATWAALSSELLESFEPPEGIRRIAIFSDNNTDFTSQKAAFSLAHRLYKKDLIVTVELPETVGSDWNNELWRSIKG